MDYQPLLVHRQSRPTQHSPESRYWRSFKQPLFVKEYAPITAVHFSPARPHKYAVTVGTQVHIYSTALHTVAKKISRFKDTARSACIRRDGKLLAAADDSGLIQVFDLNSRAILRSLQAHRQPTHHISFSHSTQTQLLSASDDTSVRLWDIPSETTINHFQYHTDYVRTAQVSPTDPCLIVSGSYDRTIRLYDTRTNNCEMVMGGGDHFDPVEQVLLFPSSTLLLSASGPILRCWDLVAGGRCLRAISNHQKTITSLSLSSDSRRILTGSLDRLVKVYDSENYRVVHTMRYPAPLLCLSISPDSSQIVAGMTDGTLSVRQRQRQSAEMPAPIPLQNLSSGFGVLPSQLGERRIASRPSSRRHPAGDETAIRHLARRPAKLKPHDKLLKAFKYSAALDSVIAKGVPPTAAFALIEELRHVDALGQALSGRDDVLLEPILRFLLKHLTDPRFSRISCEVTQLILDMYADVVGHSALIDRLFEQLLRKVSEELRFLKEVTQVKGALDMVLTGSQLSASNLETLCIREG